jgi:hypothetical protein
MSQLNGTNKLLTLIHLHQKIPKIFARKSRESCDFVVEQSMHVKTVATHESKTVDELMK